MNFGTKKKWCKVKQLSCLIKLAYTGYCIRIISVLILWRHTNLNITMIYKTCGQVYLCPFQSRLDVSYWRHTRWLHQQQSGIVPTRLLPWYLSFRKFRGKSSKSNYFAGLCKSSRKYCMDEGIWKLSWALEVKVIFILIWYQLTFFF